MDDKEREDEAATGAGSQARAIWEETKLRSRQAGERIGEEWERFSETAQGYVEEHSVGVAIGSLALGLVVGLGLGLLIRRD